MKNLKWILLLIFFQGGVIWYVFNKIVAEPDKYVFVDKYDGIKNCYTLYAHVNDTANSHLTHFRMMNFPYGDLVVFTDNTPAFAVPYKFIASRYGKPGAKVIAAFNLFILFNILLCSVISFLAMRQLVSLPLIAFVTALVLPWINPMFFRLSNHLNLSLSSIIVFWLWLLLLLFGNRANSRKFTMLSLLLTATIALSFFVHPYYVFIGGFLCGFFLFVAACARLHVRLLVSALIVPGVALLTAKLFLLLLDPLADMRGNHVIGYGFDNWEVTLASIFTPYTLNTVRFFVPEDFYPYHYETRGYIGTAAMLAIAFIIFFSGWWRKEVSLFGGKLRTIPALIYILFATALLLVMLSFGEDFYLFGTKHHFYNIFNPIYILRKTVLPELAHIRYVSRFYFPVVFILYFILAWLIEQLWRSHKTTFKAAAVILLLAMVFDFTDVLKGAPRAFPNPFSSTVLNNLEGNEIDAQPYKAILPIPYYYVGSEDVANTVETDEGFFDYTLQLSAYTGLPLMSCKMSRTPEYQNLLQLELFKQGKLASPVEDSLKGQTILVVYHKQLNQNTAHLPEQMNAVTQQVIKNGATLPARLNLEQVMETNQLIFYKWTINE